MGRGGGKKTKTGGSRLLFFTAKVSNGREVMRAVFALPGVKDNRGGRRRTERPAGRRIIRWTSRLWVGVGGSARSNGGGRVSFVGAR